MMEGTSMKRALFGLLCLLLTCVIGELLIEVAFRIKEKRPAYYLMVDYPYIYYRHQPNDGETDAEGLKTTHPIQKPSGMYSERSG